MAAVSGMRLHLLQPHRLASGLQDSLSNSKPAMNSFIHFDDHEDLDMPRRYVSDLLDSLSLGWEQDENKKEHVESIISSYRKKNGNSEAGSSDAGGSDGLSGRSVSNECSNPVEQMHAFAASPGTEWSLGAQAHASGMCKPCGWYIRKGFCSKGSDCEFCHMCDSGVFKQKKKQIIAAGRKFKRAAKNGKIPRYF